MNSVGLHLAISNTITIEKIIIIITYKLPVKGHQQSESFNIFMIIEQRTAKK